MTTWKSTKDSRIKKRGNVYWARFMKDGQHVQHSLETRSFEIAKKKVQDLEGDIALGLNWKKGHELFETAWPEFLIDKALGVKTKRARPKTLVEYEGFGTRFYIPYLANRKVAQINEDVWAEIVEKIKRDKPGMQFDNVRKYLMGFMSWAYRKGKIRSKPEFFDPDAAIKELRDEDGPGLAYTLDQLKIMRDIAIKQSPRFYLFMLMLQYMGMRPGEATQLKRDRIDHKANVIRLRKIDTKTARARVVPIHPEVLGLLNKQLEEARASSVLFPNWAGGDRPMDPTGFKKYWLEILEHPEIKGRVYDFRHTFITHAIAGGMDPIVVAKMTGTSLAMIEKRYLHLTEKNLNASLEGFKL